MSKMYPTDWMRQTMVKNATVGKEEELQSILITKLAFFDVPLTEATEDLPAKPILEYDLKVWTDEGHGIVVYLSTDMEGSMKKVANHDREMFEYKHKPLTIDPESNLYGGALITTDGKVAVIIEQNMAPGNSHEFEMPIKLTFE